jgi:hypothetical protein
MTLHDKHFQNKIASDHQVHSEIRETILNYVESWYEADPSRTESAVHVDLAKRIVEVNRDGREFLEHMGALELIQNTRNGSGPQTPSQEREKTIEIFDVNNNIATAKVVANRWVDYIHLAKINGAWQIVNAL